MKAVFLNEARLQLRSARFWVLTVLAFLFATATTVFYVFLRYQLSGRAAVGTFSSSGWGGYESLKYLNWMFGVALLFFLFDHLERDRKHLVEEVLLSRPVSSFSIIFGRALGVFAPLLTVVALVAIEGEVGGYLILGEKLKMSFLLYEIIGASVPVLLFSIALVLFLSVLFENRALSCAAYLAVCVLSSIWPGGGWWYLSDYYGLILPVFYSDMIGFGPFSDIVLQRLFFVILSLLLLTAAALIYARRRGRRREASRYGIPLCALAVMVALCGLYFPLKSSFSNASREELLEACGRYKGEDFPYVSFMKLEVSLDPPGKSLSSVATLTMENRGGKPLDRFIFTLNRGLEVQAVTVRDREVAFEREEGLLLVEPREPLSPGHAGEVMIRYAGCPRTASAELFPGEDESVWQNRRESRLLLALMGRFPSIMGRYTILIPETRWYPSPGIDHGFTFP